MMVLPWKNYQKWWFNMVEWWNMMILDAKNYDLWDARWKMMMNLNIGKWWLSHQQYRFNHTLAMPKIGMFLHVSTHPTKPSNLGKKTSMKIGVFRTKVQLSSDMILHMVLRWWYEFCRSERVCGSIYAGLHRVSLGTPGRSTFQRLKTMRALRQETSRAFMMFHPQSGWWFGCHFLCSHILGIIIPIDVHIFQRGG